MSDLTERARELAEALLGNRPEAGFVFDGRDIARTLGELLAEIDRLTIGLKRYEDREGPETAYRQRLRDENARLLSWNKRAREFLEASKIRGCYQTCGSNFECPESGCPSCWAGKLIKDCAEKAAIEALVRGEG